MAEETYFEELSFALQRRELPPRSVEEGDLLPVEWNDRTLYRVTERGVARYDPIWVDTDGTKATLVQVAETAGTIAKCMKPLETAPPPKAESLADGYRMLAEFSGTILAEEKTLLGTQFVAWAWDYDRRGVSNGHYCMEGYQTAREDFTFHSGLMAREQVSDQKRLEGLRQAAQGFLCGEGPASYRQKSRCQRILNQIRSQLPEPKQD